MAELLVVATPIGNLQDLTPRMAEALLRADLIAAEDTRVTMKLLNHLGISGKPMLSMHRHNEEKRAPELVERMLAENLTVAYASDAGTPCISDPGTELVHLAHLSGIRVTPICGPSAAIAALSASGFDAREFTFLGFLPREKKPLREKLQALPAGVSVVYESPHRVVELVASIEASLLGARLCVCCDISKKFELILAGSCPEVLTKMRANPNVEKGEYVVVIDRPEAALAQMVAEKPSCAQAVLALMLDGLDLDAACERVKPDYPRNELYKAKLDIKKRFGEG